MLFAVDIGNSSIRFGVFDANRRLCFRSRICTLEERSEDEYAVLINGLLRMEQVEKNEIKEAIVSSVVPALTHRMLAAIQKVFGVTALVVGKGLHTGFHIRMDTPAEVGADLVANAAAALAKYGAPALIVDFGAVTTISVLDSSRTFSGGCILPGVVTSLCAMRSTAAQLPEVSLDAPFQTIGRNTADSIRSGLIFGTAAATDGIIDRILAELKLAEVRLIATGGLVDLIVPQMRHTVQIERDLTLEGLAELCRINSAHRRDAHIESC